VKVEVVALAAEFPNDNPALHRGVIWVCVEPTGRAQAERLVEAPSTTPAWSSFVDEEALTVRASALYCAAALDEEAAAIVVEELEPVEASIEGEGVDPVEASVEREGEEPDTYRVPPRTSEVVLVAPPVESAALEIAAADEDAVVAGASLELPPAPDDPFTVLACTLADVALGAGSAQVASVLPTLLFEGRLPESLDEATAHALRAAGIWDGAEVAASFVATTKAWREILRGTSDDFSACGAAMLDEWASELLARLLDAPARAPMLRQELRTRGVAAFGLIDVAA
jgi:hypothetical protein